MTSKQKPHCVAAVAVEFLPPKGQQTTLVFLTLETDFQHTRPQKTTPTKIPPPKKINIPNSERKTVSTKKIPNPPKKDKTTSPWSLQKQRLRQTPNAKRHPDGVLLRCEASGTSALAEQLRVAKGLGARKWLGLKEQLDSHLRFLEGNIYIYMGVSKSSGTPTWMIYNGTPY